jgi:hypothetical protein
MKLYLHGYSSFLSDGTQDIKNILKNKYKVETRRQDAFIHLALYGAELLKEQTQIKEDDELYITSGIGDIDVIHKTNTYMYKENKPLQLFDFINLLGNTSSYYVAKTLGLKGKNIFQISDYFTYYHTLMSAYASICNNQNDVIIGSIDLISTPKNVIKRVLGIDESIEVLSSVNFQKFSLQKQGAIASIEFGINGIEESVDCKDGIFYFETKMSYMLNQMIQKKSNSILSERIGDRVNFLKVKIL